MATIKEKIKDGKLISCKFKVFLGRDENKKQIFKCMTWYPPDDLTLAKSRKDAQLAVALWEQVIKQSYLSENVAEGQATARKEQETYTFERFVKEVYMPLRMYDGSLRAITVEGYETLLKLIMPYFAAIPMQEITGMKINKYLSWLRSEYKTAKGKPLSDTTIKHHYKLLKILFRYAERQEIITKNPMEKVNAPKLSKKPVKALTENEAAVFFEAISKCDFDFRCMLHLLITTGLRRGECIGLQWQDIDFEKSVIHVNRAVVYTPVTGTIANAPKTATSIRTIPIMESTLILLQELQQQAKKQYPDAILDGAFLFGKPKNCFVPRNPSTVSTQITHFIKANGLPDISTHDLRYTHLNKIRTF